MLDAIDNEVPCPLSQQQGTVNEIKHLHGIGGNAMVRRNSTGIVRERNQFWG
jgi:hypothetical protein